MLEDKDIVFDYDMCKYTIGSIAEKRSIKAVHRESGDECTFKNRTELWGDWRKKEGGWLAEDNTKRLTPRLAEEFDVEDIQEPLPAKVATRAVDDWIDKITEQLGSRDYYGYIGKGDSWRVEASTIMKYKGQRADSLRPLHLETIEKHLIKKHEAITVTNLEADDMLVIDSYKNKKLIVVGEDKDFMGCEINFFNPNKMVKPLAIKGFGELRIGSDKKVQGHGRIWLYHQVLSGDSVDNYKANSASVLKWAEKSSFALLHKCSNDKQALEALVEGYKLLYPTPTEVTGWRGDKFDIDFMYVLQENFTMAHMLRNHTDFINVKEMFDRVGVRYV